MIVYLAHKYFFGNGNRAGPSANCQGVLDYTG